ncbi:hypothetical protein [Cupriavidus sp. DL-D2]|uniref:hypothetical protein n=1 Tax=Cupriavidus sp. DL-D2 TaxID=3144974 RepID=UPI003212DEAD
MKTIHLHGDLKSLAPEGLQIEADTPAEVMSFLSNLPGFQPVNGVKKVVRIRGIESRDALYNRTDVVDLHIEPYFGGAGGGTSIFQIIIGVVLIVVGIIASPISGGSSLSMTQAGLVIMSGALMVLGGVLQLLAPQPKTDVASSSGQSNQYLPSDQNTVKIGTRIPLLLGRIKHAGHYLSFNVTAQEWDDSAYVLPGFCNYNGEGQANRCMVSS